MTQDKERYIYRIPPCPAYDIEGTESWLASMADQGWQLSKDGFFAGLAIFGNSVPRPTRYRLTAAMKPTSMWAENGGEPDPEVVALGEMYSWEYVCVQGDFYVYRSFDPDARELNTDSEVQAAALHIVRKRRLSGLFSLCFWLVVYPILYFFKGGLVLAAIEAHSWYFFFTALLVACLFAGSLRDVISLGKLQKRLQSGEVLRPTPPPPRQVWAYHGRTVALIALLVLWVCISFSRWSADVLNENKTPLAQADPTPFATLIDIAGDGAFDYQETWPDLDYDYVQSWPDWLAPHNIKWREHARVACADGNLLDGALEVDYHEAASPWIAAALARDYVRQAKRDRYYRPLDPPALDVDFVWAYADIFDTVILQKGNIVLRASFHIYRTDDGSELTDLTMEDIAEILTGSIM